jgi:tRNA A-37 threonylcarbamoyl transferase component Bud32
MARDSMTSARPRGYSWAVVAVLVLTAVYAVTEIAFVRPYLAPEMAPVIARPPLVAADAPDAAQQLRAWRAAHQDGPGDELAWKRDRRAWAHAHLGMIVQVIVFTMAAIVLFVLRSNDLTAALCVLALALSAVAGGGPLFGIETNIPLGGVLLTIFAWLAAPLAFPIIALAIFYFPSRSPLLTRYPSLHWLPFLLAAPMLIPAAGTALYLCGVDDAESLALWDATHPQVYYLSFAAALALNVVAIAEGVYRYRFNHDANERRRIRMAVYTAVPGVLAYALKDGVPMVVRLTSGASQVQLYSTWTTILLQALVLLPAFGLVYAVGVERVLGPRLVLRRSLQYALAARTLRILPLVPAIALVVTLARDRDKTIGEVVASPSIVYVLLIVASIVALKYRDRARQWLDQRFFRQEYDARKILLSLASRVRYETDPADLASMVVTQIDEALHPAMTAILVSGVEDGRLTPVTILHGSAESLPLDGGIGSMLRWSDEPLEIFLHDPRSPARRLPPEEIEWLECTGTSLLVPVLAQDRALVAVIALGEKLSEEAYSTEDRQLLASIAAQMGLGFDVARLRLRSDSTIDSARTTRMLEPAVARLAECPRCGRCEEAGTDVCPSDGVPMQLVPSVTRVVDGKYRIEQLLGRGGMGAVYRARDVRLDRLVALKVVRAELLGDPEARRRFRREAQIVAKLQHPAIVSIFDYGTFPDGGAYLVMELVRGEDLRRVLQREGRLEPERALKILGSVCGAIEAAHREGVLHRDLKPENILLPGGHSEVEAKVLDFGVAKVVGDERVPAPDAATMVTAAGAIVGTPAYMAPEQLRAAPADARTDVFSLGVIAYEMLTGELPFGRGTLTDIVLAHVRGVRAMPAGAVAPALERAVTSALDAEPDRRPSSAQAFAHLLAAAVDL